MTASPLRLLMTADAVGGVWTYATALAGALRPLGVDTTIALLGPAPTTAARALLPAGVALVETGLPLDWLAAGPVPVRGAATALAEHARGFDLVQLNSPTLAADVVYPVPTVAVAHGCLATWWDAAEGSVLPAGMAWQADLARRGLAAVDVVVAPTAAFAEQVHRCHGLAERPIAVANGRGPIPDVGPARDAAPVFTAGRLWDRVKRTPFLDRVAARLPAPFAAAGPVTSPQGHRVDAHALRLTGTLDEAGLAGHLAARPVFVSAAVFEPFGLAVLEAAQQACPLVLSDIPSFRELWDGAATFVAPGDEDGFVAAIKALLADPARHAAQGRAAAARAARYTPDATAAAMAGLFRTLTDRRVAA